MNKLPNEELNIKKFVVLFREIKKNSELSQRQLSKLLNISLGKVNKLINLALEDELLVKKEKNIYLTKKALEKLEYYKVDNAVIFAAGFGSRFVPLTFETPKGLLEVFGEKMIERQIKHLHDVGIKDITIVVGYLKEKFEYLIDKYGVKLLYNPEYISKNTLSTLWYARNEFLNKNTYLLSSDNWIRNNMYNEYEEHSWYSSVFMEGNTKEWVLEFNKKGIITTVNIGGRDSYVMYGSVFMNKEFSNTFIKIIDEYYKKEGTQTYYWENVFIEALKNKSLEKVPMYINKQDNDNVYEFENLEELRNFDTKYRDSSDNEALSLISKVFFVREDEIFNFKSLKAGMTNNSFLFDVKGETYICRIPGKGTDKLINRKNEYESYKLIKELSIAEDVIYFDKNTGYKISRYYKNSRNADALSKEDIRKCLKLLKKLHRENLNVEHSFDLKERIEFYENLCLKTGEIPFLDYLEVKNKVIELYNILDSLDRKKTFSHIDSIFDNFIFTEKGELKLIDWEYAAMSDPLIDIAMMAIYSYFDLEKTNELIDIYFENEEVSKEEYFVIYSYMALSGFLWALWAVYKSNLGEQFGDYTLKMYRYAKEFYKISKDIKL